MERSAFYNVDANAVARFFKNRYFTNEITQYVYTVVVPRFSCLMSTRTSEKGEKREVEFSPSEIFVYVGTKMFKICGMGRYNNARYNWDNNCADWLRIIATNELTE